MFHLEGAVSRVAGGATAFGNRQVSHAITLDAVWQPGEDYGDHDIAWTRGFFAALDRFRDGVYVNFLGADEGPTESARRTETPSRAAGGRESQVRPRQRLPPQPEHPGADKHPYAEGTSAAATWVRAGR